MSFLAVRFVGHMSGTLGGIRGKMVRNIWIYQAFKWYWNLHDWNCIIWWDGHKKVTHMYIYIIYIKDNYININLDKFKPQQFTFTQFLLANRWRYSYLNHCVGLGCQSQTFQLWIFTEKKTHRNTDAYLNGFDFHGVWYSFSHNHGSGNWHYLAGSCCWRDLFFTTFK